MPRPNTAAAHDLLAQLRRDDPVRLRHLEDWIAAEGSQWIHRPNVRAVGLGERSTEGQPTGELAVVVEVARKIPEAQFPGWLDRLPETVQIDGHGIPVDVVEAKILDRGLALQGEGPRWTPGLLGERSLAAECEMGDAAGSAGTLGCLAWDGPSGRVVGVTARHVIGDGTDGTVYQPSLARGGRPEPSRLGRVSAWMHDVEGDAAIFAVEGRRPDPVFAQSRVVVTACRAPEPGMPVVMWGAATGWSRGVVSQRAWHTRSASNGWPELRFLAVVIELIDPSRGTMPGDSGAGWLSATADWQPTGELVAIHAGRHESTGRAIATAADRVFTRLGLQPWGGHGGSAFLGSDALGWAVAAREPVILRGLPDPLAARLAALSPDTRLGVVARHGEWAAVDLAGDGRIDGFVHLSLLAPLSGHPVTRPMSSPRSPI